MYMYALYFDFDPKCGFDPATFLGVFSSLATAREYVDWVLNPDEFRTIDNYYVEELIIDRPDVTGLITYNMDGTTRSRQYEIY